jgi:mRNA-degrading endonuclease HigB of HigAB toxin-antitoxin module
MIASEQLNKPEPLCNSSILTLHDAVELFLQLACENYNIDTLKSDFMGYFSLLKNKIILTQTETMKRFNQVRVSLKHHGTMVTKADLDSFKISCQNFFIENTKTVFDIDFDTISLIDLVSYIKTKEHLLLADNRMETKNYDEAIKEITLAFWEMIAEYKEDKKEEYGELPVYFFTKDFNFHTKADMFLDKENINGFKQYVKDSLESIEKILNILTLGINYQKFTKFYLMTPNYTRTFGGCVLNKWKDIEYNNENVKWCFDFVIESCITLQELDYKL